MFPLRTRGAVLLPVLVVLAAPLAAQTPSCPDPARLIAGTRGPLAHVRYLADDALQGREVASWGAHCAADYIADAFQEMGLTPAGDNDTWFQTFPVRKGAALGPDNRLSISNRVYVPGKDWVPMGYSWSGNRSAPLSYGGHGLSRPGNPDDRFVHMDVAGRILVVEWGDPDAPRGGGLRADPHFKATVAAGRRAAGLIVLLPEGADLPSPDGEIRNALSIPVLAVAGSRANEVRAAAEAGTEITLRADVAPTTADARNVVAVLPGTDPSLSAEYVIVGAHFDHLGMGGEGSLEPGARTVHNGADDNASGTAGLLDIARRITEGPPPARSILFIAFTGEEEGLWGSAHFVAQPTVSLTGAEAMLNLDMVGRLTENTVTVSGTGTAQEWEDVASAANQKLAQPLRLAFFPDGYGPSDHASFTAAGIPVLHFFTNTHSDYHRPADDWDKIDGDGIARIAEVATNITRMLAGGGGTPPTSLTKVGR